MRELKPEIKMLIEEYEFLKSYIKEECSENETIDAELEKEYNCLFNRFSKVFNAVSTLDDDWDYIEKYL